MCAARWMLRAVVCIEKRAPLSLCLPAEMQSWKFPPVEHQWILLSTAMSRWCHGDDGRRLLCRRRCCCIKPLSDWRQAPYTTRKVFYIYINTYILSRCSRALHVHGDDGSSFYRGKSPRPPRALLNPLTSLMKKHFYADAVKKLPAETRKYYECPPSPSLCRRYNSIMATPNGVCEISRDENLLLKRFAVERGD